MPEPDFDSEPEPEWARPDGPDDAGAASRRRRANKYRRALAVLNRGRDVLIDQLADELIDRGEDYQEGGFLFQDFLDSHGPRMQFVCVIGGMLEQAAATLEEWEEPTPPPPQPQPPRRRRRRSEASPDRVERPTEDSAIE